MKHFIVVLSFVLLSTVPSHAFFAEAGLGLTFGSSSFNELAGSYSVKHTETAFSVGFGLMGRAGIQLTQFVLAASGFYEWEGSSLTYTPSNQSLFSTGTYSITNRRHGFGPHVAFYIPGTTFRLFADYYPYVNNTIQWAENKSQNPFAAGDWLTGWGYGLGLGYNWFPFLAVQATYRSFTYTKVSARGVGYDIPGAKFDKAQYSGVYTGASFVF